MRYLPLLLAALVCFQSCNEPAKGRDGKVYKNAVEYNQHIIDHQSIVMDKIMSFSRLDEQGFDTADAMLERYEREMGPLIGELRSMPPFKGDSSFRDAAINLFGFYRQIFGNEYKKLVEVRRNSDNYTNDEWMAAMNAIVDDISRQEERYDKAFQTAQEKFAKDNKMRLLPNSKQKEIDKMNE